MDTFNDRVSARTALAERLQSTHAALAREVGILPDDLDAILREGRAAASADAEQRAQEAEQSTTISIRAAALATLRTRETELRARIPAVVADLERGGDTDLALFLRHKCCGILQVNSCLSFVELLLMTSRLDDNKK